MGPECAAELTRVERIMAQRACCTEGRADGRKARISNHTAPDEFQRVGRWFLAEERRFGDRNQEWEHGAHKQTKAYAVGLPEGCTSFHDRYKNYTGPFKIGNPNLRNPSTEYAVLIRIHHGLRWTEDLRLAMRAIISESAQAGWHVWLLSQDSIGPDPAVDTGPAQFLLAVPEEFRPLLQTFTAEQLHSLYPNAHHYRIPGSSGYNPQKREYLGPTAFMRRFPLYRFAFVVEYDVRFIGLSWGEFFTSALHIAIRQLVDSDTRSSILKPKAHRPAFPDLLLFSHEISGVVPVAIDNGVSNDPQFKFPPNSTFKEMAVIYGMSHKMVQTIHRYSTEGYAGFIEEFLPTVAAHSDVDVVVIPLGEWDETLALHCCTNLNEGMYKEWQSSGLCHPFTILHPVKNSQDADIAFI